MDSRSDILERLGGQPVTDATPQRSEFSDVAQRRRAFADCVVAARCTLDEVASLEDVPERIRQFLEGRNLQNPIRLAPELAGRIDLEGAVIGLPVGEAIDDGQIVVASCAGGIAETGSLVINSGSAHDPRLIYVAETLIVLIGADQIVAHHEDVWPIVKARAGQRVPRLVSFVTGPSRTADIEQTIEFGAHGARYVHVVIVEEGL